jgi:hypothetical protein
MSRFAKAFHLTCAIIASLTCFVYTVVVGIVLFHWRTIDPHLDPEKFLFFLFPALLMGAGAMMEFSFYNDERKGHASDEERSLVTSGGDTASTGFVMITTRQRALAAIAFTLWTLVHGVRSLSSTRPYSLIWLYSGLLPHWAVLLITIAVYGAFVLIAVHLTLAPSRKEERALMFTVVAVPLLAPLGVLIPRATSLLRFLQVLLELTALLASISILLFLQTYRGEKPREEEGI